MKPCSCRSRLADEPRPVSEVAFDTCTVTSCGSAATALTSSVTGASDDVDGVDDVDDRDDMDAVGAHAGDLEAATRAAIESGVRRGIHEALDGLDLPVPDLDIDVDYDLDLER